MTTHKDIFKHAILALSILLVSLTGIAVASSLGVTTDKSVQSIETSAKAISGIPVIGVPTCTNVSPALIISYEDTSADGPIFQNQANQDFARFVLHAECKLKLNGLVIYNKEPNLFPSEITAYKIFKGYGNPGSTLPMLGTVGGAGSFPMTVTFFSPVVMNKDETIMITVRGNVATVPAGKHSQTCIDAGLTMGANFLTDAFGNILSGALNTFPALVEGHATCGDRQPIN